MADRVMGRDVEVLIINGREPVIAVTDIKSAEVTLKLELKSEGYLGQKTNKSDEVYDGVDGKLSIHSGDALVFALLASILDRARRRAPGLKFNVKVTLNYPSGATPRIIIPDVHWGAIPINAAGKNDYVSMDLPFAAEDAKIISQ